MSQPNKAQLEHKIVLSDVHDANDSDHSGEIQKMHSFDLDPMKNKDGADGGRKVFKASTKKKMQLTFQEVVIKTIPKQKKCCNRGNAPPQEPKVILNNVSGTIAPGQFLSIIGASGKTSIFAYYVY
jgi:ABC-type multidrug transport system fused ATPase/permease subunit